MLGERDYVSTEDRPWIKAPPPLNRSQIKCEAAVKIEWKFGDLYKGEQPGVHLPFDVSDPASDAHLLGPDLLVKQGVERAEDVHDPLGTRKLSRFDFSILESQPMGESPPEEDGHLAERFYGIPQDVRARDTYVDGWQSEPINPNMPHLLVFTFYEVRQEGDLKFTIGGEEFQTQEFRTVGYGAVFKLPKRQIRRVVCRAMIHPSGFSPSTGESEGIVKRLTKKAFSFVSKQLEQFGGWLAKILASISEVPSYLGVQTSELVCGGLGKLDDLTSLDNVSGPPLPALVDKEGRIRVNAAVRSKLEGSKRCHRISSPPVSTCEGDADRILQGKCIRLPEFKLQVRTAEFIRPKDPVDPDDPLDEALDFVYDEYRVEVPVDSYYPEHGGPGFVSVVNAVKDGFANLRGSNRFLTWLRIPLRSCTTATGVSPGFTLTGSWVGILPAPIFTIVLTASPWSCIPTRSRFPFPCPRRVFLPSTCPSGFMPGLGLTLSANMPGLTGSRSVG